MFSLLFFCSPKATSLFYILCATAICYLIRFFCDSFKDFPLRTSTLFSDHCAQWRSHFIHKLQFVCFIFYSQTNQFPFIHSEVLPVENPTNWMVLHAVALRPLNEIIHCFTEGPSHIILSTQQEVYFCCIQTSCTKGNFTLLSVLASCLQIEIILPSIKLAAHQWSTTDFKFIPNLQGRGEQISLP